MGFWVTNKWIFMKISFSGNCIFLIIYVIHLLFIQNILWMLHALPACWRKDCDRVAKRIHLKLKWYGDAINRRPMMYAWHAFSQALGSKSVKKKKSLNKPLILVITNVSSSPFAHAVSLQQIWWKSADKQAENWQQKLAFFRVGKYLLGGGRGIKSIGTHLEGLIAWSWKSQDERRAPAYILGATWNHLSIYISLPAHCWLMASSCS